VTDWSWESSEAPTGGSSDEQMRLSDLGKLARRARRQVVSVARAEDRPTFHKLLRAHLGAAVEDLEVVVESWPEYDQVNVQVGLDAWLAAPGREHELVGMTRIEHMEFGLADLLRPQDLRYGPVPGNVIRANVAGGPDGKTVQVVRAGLYLVRDGDVRTAVLLLPGDSDMGTGGVHMHVVSDRTGAAQETATGIREESIRLNVFRGQVISFGQDMFGERAAVLQFHSRPVIDLADVILPEETLAVIQRQAIGVAEHRERLLAARQHLKRGLLLFGPPGVGKTHTVRYLTSQLTDTTIVLLSGESLGLVGTACSVARTLQPAMIVIEDVDLIAEERGMHPGRHPLLFELLNEMDGLAEDADVIFLLTTNRVDVLEPALASRPGRVDQAVALDLPDAEARRRLFDLYKGSLVVDDSRLDDVIARTEDVTASFLKELLRRSALISAQASDGPPIEVSADELDEALAELLDTRNAMTRALLGGTRSTTPPYPSDEYDDEEY
jgi:hypothetical protein